MNTHNIRSRETVLAQAQSRRGQPISRLLIDDGQVAPRSMLGALAESERLNAPLVRVLEAESLASREDILHAQADHWGALVVGRTDVPPDPALSGLLDPEFCLQHGVLPWMRIGETVVLATSRPDQFDALLAHLPGDFGPVMMAVALETDIHAEIASRFGAALAQRAEARVPQDESCRDINVASTRGLWAGAVFALLGLATLALAPQLFFAVALALAVTSLLLAQGLKLAALLASGRPAPARAALSQSPSTPVSILVPLFREKEIADTLVARLSRLSYPKSLLEVLLVLEADDTQTQAALAGTTLPPWMRLVEVPPGSIKTKPRALNYALGFSSGDIIGVYDAEDAPATNQIDRVVAEFARAPPHVACLQGILDFYNPRANWLSRCFAIEYASWFRVLLPGMARLGFAIPLGGTTIFFRRKALEHVGGWDAHNVTEDADLGIRLARYGYVTRLVPSVTREEANNLFWPWIKQRSRWLKGYGITWWVHSRNPRRLWRDLGPWRFLGMQLLFLTTLVQFIFAPVLWSFWLILFGLPHPLSGMMDNPMTMALIAVFLSAEAISLVVGVAAVARSPHRSLVPWVPTLIAYFPLGTAAIYKALWETITNPFYWDKTSHGRSAPDKPGADLAEE
ncbi:MAG: glycosyltransferase family 2 protein [Paracoccaceae bacterium]|nr:glycosyltransferase family 2 protein [Paracoccaceae bacterium]